MDRELLRCELTDLGVLRLQGIDAERFLQGQLSNDVLRVGPERSLLAGYHNPQGRSIALLRLVHVAEGDLLAILPRELAVPVAQRLGKFVLRAKVRITDDSDAWSMCGLIDAYTSAAVGEQRRVNEAIRVCVQQDPSRWLEISPRATQAGDAVQPDPGADREHWRALDVAAGLPQVYASTSERFVAQMLNLDVLGAIAFDKGCYTGQEVIARAHYRGRVKRRMQRFRSRRPLALAAGETGTLPDGRAFTVIEATKLADGRCEFLAVAPLAGADASAGEASEPAAQAVDAEALPLPYALPE